MTHLQSEFFEENANRIITIISAGVALYISHEITDETALQLLLALVLAVLFAGVATYVRQIL